MKVPKNAVTAPSMRALDKQAVKQYGIPSLLLMENAGRGISELILGIASPYLKSPARNDVIARSRAKLKTTKQSLKVVVVCGKGNNGGDGLVIARHLTNRGHKVRIFLIADPSSLKNDPAVNFEIISKMKIPVTSSRFLSVLPALKKSLVNADIIVDALFGVGLNSDLEEPFYSVVKAMNLAGKKVVAVDVPSGLNADTGEVMGIAVKANMTGTLGLPKKGLYLKDGPKYSGKITVIDIGLPQNQKTENR